MGAEETSYPMQSCGEARKRKFSFFREFLHKVVNDGEPSLSGYEVHFRAYEFHLNRPWLSERRDAFGGIRGGGIA